MLVKICGIQSFDIAKIALDNHADFLGFIFVEGRRRYIAPERAKKIIEACRALGCQTKFIGVFIDAELKKINDIAKECALDFVQLHGHETAEFARKISCDVIKVFRWRDDFFDDEASIQKVNEFPAKAFLFDSFTKEKNGGTGKVFDWSEACHAMQSIEKKFLIAGGISEENIADVQKIFASCQNFLGVDVSGSVENSFGEKDKNKVQQFLVKAKKL